MPISRLASLRLADTLGPEAICTPAMRKMVGAGGSGAGCAFAAAASSAARGFARPKPNRAVAGTLLEVTFFFIVSSSRCAVRRAIRLSYRSGQRSLAPGRQSRRCFELLLDHARRDPGACNVVL